MADFANWTADEIGAWQARKARLDTADAVRAAGGNQHVQSDAAGTSYPTIWRDRRDWQMAEEAGNARLFLPEKSTGRPPLATPTPEDIVKLKSAYIRTNRCREKGSKTLAALRLALKGELSPETTAAILKPRASKHTLTKTIRDCMHVAPSIVRLHRSPRNARLAGIYCPGTMRIAQDEDGMRQLKAGERQSWDDGSINFCVCVPWPYGGDKCADKYGVKVGRFQLLAGIDDASDYCPGWSFVMRPLSSYRKQDVASALRRCWSDTYQPQSVVLEGGAWQSHMVLRLCEIAGVKTIDAKGRPHCKLIEGYWNRLWSWLSTVDGQIGRYRGEMEQENGLWMRAQQGRIDPRVAFPDLRAGLAAIDEAMGLLQSVPAHSKTYGTWIPAERHAAGLAENPRPALDASLAWLAAPEQHERIVLRGGMVSVKTQSPFGVAFPYHFASDELAEVEGARVRVHFDPWDSPIKATVVMAGDHAGRRAGEVLSHYVPCLDSAPEVLDAARGLEVGFDLAGLDRAISMRRDVSRAMRTEYRSMGFRGKRSFTEIRGGDGSLLQVHGGRGDGVVVDGTQAEAEGCAPQRRGERGEDAGRMPALPGRRAPALPGIRGRFELVEA